MQRQYVQSPREAIDRYLSHYTRRQWPISVATASRALRSSIPYDVIDDDELAEMVAIAAVEGGFCVSFDADLLRPRKSA